MTYQRADLDSLLSGVLSAEAPLFRRLEWLAKVLNWIFSESPLKQSELDFSTGYPQALRVKWILHVLDRNPDWQLRVVAVLRSIAAETRIYDLLIQAGIHQETGLFSEMIQRISRRFLPLAPNDQNLEVFVFATFRNERAAQMIAKIDEVLFRQLIGFFHDQSSAQGWIEDLGEARSTLAIQIAALGSHPDVRNRLPSHQSPSTVASQTPFFRLHSAVFNRQSPAEIAYKISLCLAALDDVYTHMDEHGVSIALVYHLERMRALLNRLRMLTEVFIEPEYSSHSVQRLMSNLILESVHARSLRGLFDDNTALIARKIVENSAETGDHYIARTAVEEKTLFRSALGGGLVTALTTALKFFIASIPGSPFALGFLTSLNYAGSFIALQLRGFSLATKQPAMTAATLAEKLSASDDSPIVAEVLNVARSQTVAVFGNLLAVTPGVVGFCWLYELTLKRPFLGAEKAVHTIESFSIFGGTPFYAAWTGVLLFLSSLIAGWFYHWVLYRKLSQGISRSLSLNRLIGVERSRKFAHYFKKHAAGFAANISLGFLLGLTPFVCQFLGLPLDVRHITLSTGSLAASVMTLGWKTVVTSEFWLAVLGILSMGFFNIFISFSLALAVALRAQRIPIVAGLRVFAKAAVQIIKHPSLVFGPRA